MQADPPVSAPAGATMRVNFVIGQAPQAPQAAPPPPPPVAVTPPPKPAASLIATPSPAPAPAITPPPEAVSAGPAQPVASVAAPASAPAAAPSEPAVTPPDYRAAYLNNPGPRYPVASRRRREQGIVMLKVRVSPTGEPEQVQVDQSSGFAELDQAAASVVKERWRFVPARQGDRPVAAWVAVPMQFSLKDR